MTATTSETVDLFTPIFKHFRRLPVNDCFTQAYSPSSHPTLFQTCPLNEQNNTDYDLESFGLRSISTWSLYSCEFSEGLYFLSNPFTIDGQCQWINRCINQYSRQNKTNIGDNFENEHLTRLRWVTLGYHYDWTNKIYNNNNQTKMPDEIEKLCEILMKIISINTNCSMMKAEAAIINYYHHNSTLCAHTDHSEFDALTKPLISFSFGNTAVFLIGSHTKSECSPLPLLLRSGDIILMTGKSRLCYHAIPRILIDSNFHEKFSSKFDEFSWNYIHDKRINMNIRQVYD